MISMVAHRHACGVADLGWRRPEGAGIRALFGNAMLPFDDIGWRDQIFCRIPCIREAVTVDRLCESRIHDYTLGSRDWVAR